MDRIRTKKNGGGPDSPENMGFREASSVRDVGFSCNEPADREAGGMTRDGPALPFKSGARR